MSNIDEEIESQIRRDKVLGRMRHSDRGFHHGDAVKAAEETRSDDADEEHELQRALDRRAHDEGLNRKSHDPYYHNSKKNR